MLILPKLRFECRVGRVALFDLPTASVWWLRSLGCPTGRAIFGPRLRALSPWQASRRTLSVLQLPPLILNMPSNELKVRAAELQTKGRADLLKQLDELKTELASLRVAKISGGQGAKVMKM